MDRMGEFSFGSDQIIGMKEHWITFPSVCISCDSEVWEEEEEENEDSIQQLDMHPFTQKEPTQTHRDQRTQRDIVQETGSFSSFISCLSSLLIRVHFLLQEASPAPTSCLLHSISSTESHKQTSGDGQTNCNSSWFVCLNLFLCLCHAEGRIDHLNRHPPPHPVTCSRCLLSFCSWYIFSDIWSINSRTQIFWSLMLFFSGHVVCAKRWCTWCTWVLLLIWEVHIMRHKSCSDIWIHVCLGVSGSFFTGYDDTLSRRNM